MLGALVLAGGIRLVAGDLARLALVLDLGLRLVLAANLLGNLGRDQGHDPSAGLAFQLVGIVHEPQITALHDDQRHHAFARRTPLLQRVFLGQAGGAENPALGQQVEILRQRAPARDGLAAKLAGQRVAGAVFLVARQLPDRIAAEFRSQIGRDERVVGVIVRCGEDRGIGQEFDIMFRGLAQNVAIEDRHGRSPCGAQMVAVGVGDQHVHIRIAQRLGQPGREQGPADDQQARLVARGQPQPPRHR